MGTKTVPARTYQVVDKVICDICKREGHETHHEGVGWCSGYEVLDTAIYLKVGESYPEGTSLEFTECDICPSCFKQYLIPFLQSLGVTMQERNVEY
jgi:hypothetical protein